MATSPPPFTRYEWMIAWRYLRARRAEGGVSVMTWISLIGITLAVMALIATMSVRSGFRAEFVDTILGANAHIAVYGSFYNEETGETSRLLPEADAIAARISELPGVTRAAPLIRGQVISTHEGRTAGAEVYGLAPGDFLSLPGIRGDEAGRGDLQRFGGGVAIGSGIALQLGLRVGEQIRLISPDGVKTPFGTSPRVKTYEVVYIFSLGRYDIDRTRIYMPFKEAQAYFNRDAGADEIEVMVSDPEDIDQWRGSVLGVSGAGTFLWTWEDSASAFLRALEIEDNVMFVIMAILVLIAAMNIVSGLIMLVKNKGRDIGILRTIGLSEGAVLRVFFLCGAATGLLGTLFGVILGCLFAIYIDQIFSFVNWVGGGGVWDPSIRGIYEVPAKLELANVLAAVALSLGLSFCVTYFPARRAARMNPVEALRYE
ncbi:MAG: ABC transporter permease [Pseudomonadota bacterium]